MIELARGRQDLRRLPSRRTQLDVSHKPIAKGKATEWLVNALFAFFVLGASGGLSAFAPLNYEIYFWLPAYAAMAWAFVTRDKSFFSAIRASSLLLAWPLLALLSTAWSLVPGMTFYHGFQLLMTLLMGSYLCSRLSLDRLLLVLALGLAASQVTSVAAVVLRPEFALGTDGTLIGSFPHKNTLGFMMAIQALTCTCLLRANIHPWMACVGLGAAVLFLLLSHSGTALLALPVALMPLGVVLCSKGSVNLKGLLCGVVLCALAVLALLLTSRGGTFVELVLGGLGKDDSLTGRTTLWTFGSEQFWQSPYIGIGFQAYWNSPETSVRYLQYVIQQDLWFFHNNFIDVAVAFGVLGLAIFVVGLVYAVVRSIGFLKTRAEPVPLWRIMFTICAIVETLAEAPLFMNHSLSQVLFIVAVTPCRDRVGGGGSAPPRSIAIGRGPNR